MFKGAFLLPYAAALSTGFPKGKDSSSAPDFLFGGPPDVLESSQDDSITETSDIPPLHDALPPADSTAPAEISAFAGSEYAPQQPLAAGDALNNEFLPANSSDSIQSADCADEPLLGGQAVMEGVLMRNGASYALALRQTDGAIVVERRRWYSLIPDASFFKKPFIRGFSILVETLVNGVKALNRSAVLTTADEDELSDWQLIVMLLVSLLLALGLFIVVPHLLSLGMTALGLSGDMQGLSFHVWDGLFKFAVFIGYIAAIAMVPEIRRVFQYHGAEHKTIACFERGGPMSVRAASRCSRLHPRCGTTFLLFVLSFAIVLHAILVPLLLWVWNPQNSVLKHTGVLCFKILLMIPISALAYELIRFAAKLGSGFIGTALRAPGLLLQCLTTREPDDEQLEVAIIALYEALNESQRATVHFEIPAYTVLE